jgi:hypothetical protein
MTHTIRSHIFFLIKSALDPVSCGSGKINISTRPKMSVSMKTATHEQKKLSPEKCPNKIDGMAGMIMY